MTFPTPRNLNYWYTFGGILAFCLGVQIVTGIVLAMHYDRQRRRRLPVGPALASCATSTMAGWSDRPARQRRVDVLPGGLPAHYARGMYYGSYKAPREVLWLLGCVIYVLMMATAFMGYVLPWGQMSFWGAKVITSLFGAFPVIGKPLTTLLWGGFSVDRSRPSTASSRCTTCCRS